MQINVLEKRPQETFRAKAEGQVCSVIHKKLKGAVQGNRKFPTLFPQMVIKQVILDTLCLFWKGKNRLQVC
jgi:hypothetical protein